MPSDSLHPRPDSAHPAPDADTARQTAGGRAASGPTSGSDGQAVTYRATIPREIWVLVSAAVIVALGYGLIAPLLPQFVVSFDVSSGAAARSPKTCQKFCASDTSPVVTPTVNKPMR